MSDFDFSFDVPDFDDESKFLDVQQNDDGITAAMENSHGVLSDNDVARIFGEISAAALRDEEVLRQASEVLAAEKILADAEAEHLAIKAALDKQDREILALEQEIARRKREREPLKSAVWDMRTAYTRAERTRDEKMAAAAVAKQNVEQAAAIEEEMSSLEEKAAKFNWFNGIERDGVVMKAMQHQMMGMYFLVNGKRCILGDRMGLGKTLTAIGSLDLSGAKRVLIITPADITTNFQREIQFWADHRPAINLRGQTRLMKKQMLEYIGILDSFTVIINYESWRRDPRLLTHLVSLGFDTVICDEAHTMKDTATDAFQGVRQIVHAVNKCPRDGSIMVLPDGADTKLEAGRKCPICNYKGESTFETSAEGSGGMSFDERFWLNRSVQRVYPMTGTAILNKPEDLFSLLNLTDPINFRVKNRYLEEYAQWDYNARRYVFAAGGIDRLMKRLSGRYLARTMKDAGIVLPPQQPITHTLSLEMYPKQAEVIRQLTENAALALDEDKKATMTAIIAVITRQRQANVHPGGIVLKENVLDENGFPTGEKVETWRVSEYTTESVKLDKAVSLIKEFTANGERLVVFSQFSTALQELNQRVNLSLNDEGNLISSVVFDGSTPQSVREEIKTNFDRKTNEAKKWDVVMANYKTGGTGLNLTAATHVIALDREWNPGREDQALARVLRIGQTENTFVHILEIEDTVDEWMNELINQKADMIAGFDAGADDLRQALADKLKNYLNKGK